MDEKKIKKIRDLLDLSQSDNIYEAEDALKKAQRLAAKYGISMDDVFGAKEEKVLDESFFELKQKTVPTWVGRLAMVICDNFKTKAYIRGGQGWSKLMILGLKEDVEVTKYVITYTMDCFDKFFKKFLKSKGSTSRSESIRLRNDYFEGFLKGIREAFSENVKEFGLVLVCDALVEKRYAELHLRQRRTVSARSFDRDAWEAGKRDGRSISQRDRIHG